jgi:dihydroorotate dehydrogenase (fumarate)
MADLNTNLCGIPLANPLILASGPLSWSARGVQAAFAAGAAAVVTKTIRPEATVNPVPHIADAGRGSMVNTEGWSDYPARQWIDYELPAIREWLYDSQEAKTPRNHPGVLIASAGHTPAEVAQLADPLVKAGADVLELVSYRASDAAPMVAVAKEAVSVPVLIKVSANWPNVVDVIEACLASGADGITAIDSIGPTLRIDVDTGQPLLGSFAWLSGQAIRPIALRVVADACLRHDLPIVGTGGVESADDVVEMVMAGATAVGVHTAPLLRGLDWFGKTLTKLERWLEARGRDSLLGVRGVALPHLRQPTSHTPMQFLFDKNTCTQCGRCVVVCAYEARELTPAGDMELDPSLCRSCGLCVSVCRPGALQSQ